MVTLYVGNDPAKPWSAVCQGGNAYLKVATGQEITAKDFRTWNGTVLAASALTGHITDPREYL